MSRGISLANKCQLLFGLATLLIIVAALLIPWVRYAQLVDDAQLETSRQVAKLWAENTVLEPKLVWVLHSGDAGREEGGSDVSIRYWPSGEWSAGAFGEDVSGVYGTFLDSARERVGVEESIEHSEAVWDGEDRVYRYARLLRDDEGIDVGVVVVERRSASAAGQLLINRAYLVVAGLLAGALAVLVFYIITMRIILGPVRSLRDTAELVREGNLHIRADIQTGDEFEQLSDTFNAMLEEIVSQQVELRGINRSLDLKMTELAEQNVRLYEAARMKSEFLANISHELRTPLNSIIGFTEILHDIAGKDLEAVGVEHAPSVLEKRGRYLDHILTAGRSLLVMINELLEMAKIEAGKVELHVQSMNVAETCEGLLALIRPLADRKGIGTELALVAAGGGFTSDAGGADVPVIETDQQKFQQVVFNFLSNAVKFTASGGRVTLRAERVVGGDEAEWVRVSVLDTGAGIPEDQQETIFEKFSQVDSGHTREFAGTGLGLAIAKEFAGLIGGEVVMESEVGRGSMFSLIVPIVFAGASKTISE